MPFDFQDELWKQDGDMPYVYFVEHGIISLVIEMKDGMPVEIGTIGYEGMLGIAVYLGADTAPTRAFCQVAGDGFRLESGAFTKETHRRAALNKLVGRYSQAFMQQLAQSTACNRAHPVEQRLCRWLLMTQDQVDAPEFSLTQEFLSQMLGVRRASVTVVAGMLQRAGMIEYHRGKIKVLNRKKLEETACECYQVIKEKFDKMYA